MHALIVLALLCAAAYAQTTTPPSTTINPLCPAFAVNFTRCPNLEGASVPNNTKEYFNTTNFDPDAFYNFLAGEFCDCNGQLIGKKWICAFIYSIYVSNCGEITGTKQKLSCRSACEATVGQSEIARCTNVTSLPSLSCSGTQWGDDQAKQCQRNNAGGDKCTRPPFLNRKTGGVPNWFFVIIIPIIVLVLVVAVVGFILYRMKHDELSETLNPCKWCECCPGYWDL